MHLGLKQLRDRRFCLRRLRFAIDPYILELVFRILVLLLLAIIEAHVIAAAQ